MDIDEILAGAALPEATHQLCLDGPLLAEYAEAEAMARQARARSDKLTESGGETMGGRREVAHLDAHRDALAERIRESSLTLRLRGLSFADYNALLVEHPPRDGSDEDKALGFNPGGFLPALVRRSVVDPALTGDQWDRVDAALTDRAFDDLAGAALRLNRRESARVPFSVRDSGATPG